MLMRSIDFSSSHSTVSQCECRNYLTQRHSFDSILELHVFVIEKKQQQQLIAVSFEKVDLTVTHGP